MEVDAVITNEWRTRPELSAAVEETFSSAIAAYRANPNLLKEHVNHEESIRVGGYSDRTILELVQNAADAMSGDSDGDGGAGDGRIEIVLELRSRTLYCANSGRPFDRSGITALAHAHLSQKRGDEIGRFGLGFKSVLAVSRRPQVFSKSVSFEFGSSRAIDAMAAIGTGLVRFPVLRTITEIDPIAEFDNDDVLSELSRWAVTIVRLSGVDLRSGIQKQIENFRSEFMLFARNVHQITIRVVDERGADNVTSHRSEVGEDGRISIVNPDGNRTTWFVMDRMHAPTADARRQVGEAVSRESIKVSAAVPSILGNQRIGQFWSYFPLADRTSASGIFNAPWSVNDDRTTLLKNLYNREILRTMAGMFVDLMSKVSKADDPAVHLDYLPARGREVLSMGDDELCAQVPFVASRSAIVPDALGVLSEPADLVPVEFSLPLKDSDFEAWQESPNTPNNTPHSRCYSNAQRVARLRSIYINAVSESQYDPAQRDESKLLAAVKTMGIRSWLREWADGPDSASTINAIRFAVRNRSIPGVSDANIVPTTSGLCSIDDASVVYLRRNEDLPADGYRFIAPEFLRISGVEQVLRAAGFGDLDPKAVFVMRLDRLTSDVPDGDHQRIWDSMVDLPSRIVVDTIRSKRALLKVPVVGGKWVLPHRAYDIQELAEVNPDIVLDRHRCDADIAHSLGVTHAPERDYALENEVDLERLTAEVIAYINAEWNLGNHRVTSIDLERAGGPGPFSALYQLKDADAPLSLRERWTSELFRMSTDRTWQYDDADGDHTFEIESPAVWVARSAGILKTLHGYLPVSQVVSASLLKFAAFLPLFRGDPVVERAAGLPRELCDVPAEILRSAMNNAVTDTGLSDSTLVEFVLSAYEIAYADGSRGPVLARVGKHVEPRPARQVFVAADTEQVRVLNSKQRPYLVAGTPSIADRLVNELGCSRYEDSFSFSLEISGMRDPVPVLDVFPGLRRERASGDIENISIVRATEIVKLETTPDGVESIVQNCVLQGTHFVVRADLDERLVLEMLSAQFSMNMSNADMSRVMKATLNANLERIKEAARGELSDAERLEVYFGDDTLKEGLPTGLIGALEKQGLMDGRMSVAELFLTVYGADSIRQLSSAFANEGFDDVPTTWAGSPQAIAWLRTMGFGSEYAGRRAQRDADEFVVPSAVHLDPLHRFQREISSDLAVVLTERNDRGHARKGLVELPTGAGKTRVATETILRQFEGYRLSGTVLWIAQSIELCEQAVQTFSKVWRGLNVESPLTVGRLWERNVVNKPDTEYSVVVATDAKLNSILGEPSYEWLRSCAAVIVDEAHRIGGRYDEIFQWLGVQGECGRPLVGLSATPFKGRVGDNERTRKLAKLFDNNRMSPFDGNAYEQLAQQKFLARVNHQVLRSGLDVELSESDIEQVRTLRRLPASYMESIGKDEDRMNLLVDDILSRDPDWPVLVFTPSVLSAQVLAASLKVRGVAAASVSGMTASHERRRVIDEFKEGRIRVLANCDLLIQGFDAPGVRVLYIARPVFSPGAYIQMVGRGLRGPRNGGKEECLIVDVEDNLGAANEFMGFRDYQDVWRG